MIFSRCRKLEKHFEVTAIAAALAVTPGAALADNFTTTVTGTTGQSVDLNNAVTGDAASTVTLSQTANGVPASTARACWRRWQASAARRPLS